MLLTLIVPKEVGLSHIYGIDGRIYQSRVSEDGRVVIDVPRDVFNSLLADKRFGLLWHNENAEALRVLGTMVP